MQDNAHHINHMAQTSTRTCVGDVTESPARANARRSDADPFMITYARSTNGFAVARVGEISFAMVPTQDGRHFLATGWRIPRPLELCTRADFYGHSGELADEAAFRARVEENAQHQRERAALGRTEIASRAHTPWGFSYGATVYAEGVTSHSTASHGGFHLSAERNRKVHPLLRVKEGWYEEDSAWAAVAITFPELFTAFERRCAERTIKDSSPDAWEAMSGTVLAPGESYEKDRRVFHAEHAGDWIVISAITSKTRAGYVETIATLGGNREVGLEHCRFLVPSSEYTIGRFGFVINVERHHTFAEASSISAS